MVSTRLVRSVSPPLVSVLPWRSTLVSSPRATEVLAHFRSRLDAPLMEERLAIQAATAMEDGLVSPAHLVVDTFPSEQGSQRVHDAATLYKAPKKSSRSSRP